MDYDFNILYYINMYKKWWKQITKIVIISIVFTMIFSLLMPVSYVSSVTLILSGGGGGSSPGSIGKLLGIAGLSGTDSSTDIIASLLSSRRMAKDIRDKFNLDKNRKFRYGINTREIKGGFAIDVTGSDPFLT